MQQHHKLEDDYDEQRMREIFRSATIIVSYHRPWFSRQVSRYALHPIVSASMKLCRPADWHQLLLEWPHRSDNDPNMVAFTRDERGGDADRVVITSMGKYIARHFPILPDHYVRDLVAMYGIRPEKMELRHGIDDIIEAAVHGPRSCMSWDMDEDDGRIHPYSVYSPKYGWHIAVRLGTNGDIDGRALCYTLGEKKIYVRSYKRCPNGGYSHADDVLEAWLNQQGYEHANSWVGAKLAYIEGYPFVAPYLDGAEQGVVIDTGDDGRQYLRVTRQNAEYLCNGTDGTPEECNRTNCEDCGDRIDDDDAVAVGPHEDRTVCGSCQDYNYTLCRTRRGWERYIENDEVIEVNGTFYDVSYLSDNNIVQLYDGDYASLDDCVEVDGDYYDLDDNRIVCMHDGEYAMRDDCVRVEDEWHKEEDCVEIEGDWYLKEQDCVEIDGQWYLKEDEAVVLCSDDEYRLKTECFCCPSCGDYHSLEVLEQGATA